MSKRKVVSIPTLAQKDVVTVDELRHAQELYFKAWRAGRDAHEAALAIGKRVENGAQLEKCHLHWNAKLNSVVCRYTNGEPGFGH